MPHIVSMQETEPRQWVAKYKGNYGTYTIRLTVGEDGKAEDFNCTCPSDYHPCKHIGMIMEAIPKYAAKNDKAMKADKVNPISPAKLLAKVPEKKLRKFVIEQAAKNTALRKAVILEFAPKTPTQGIPNPYAQVIREGLREVELDDDGMDDWGYHNEEGIPLDILDEMFEKAKKFIANGKFDEAVLIAKACLEEFAKWSEEQDCNVDEQVQHDYFEEPFSILRAVLEKDGCDADALYAYCKTQLRHLKNDDWGTLDHFHDLMLALAKRTRNADFVAVQEQALGDLKGEMASYKAERILNRMMDYHTAVGEQEKADAILHANLHVYSFRQKVVDALIAGKKYADAKALIVQYSGEKKWPGAEWDKRLLTIARAETDIPKIREIAWGFIEQHFDREYYRIYKAAFGASDWPAEFERLVEHYTPKHGYHAVSGKCNVADVLAEEKLSGRLLELLEKTPSPEAVEHYHKHFAKEFPGQTLALFKKSVDAYAAQATGNSRYEEIAKWLGMIRKIPGGEAVCDAMLANYRETYKRRPAMMRILPKKFK